MSEKPLIKIVEEAGLLSSPGRQLTTAEAAEYLGMQPRSVVGIIRQGRLSAVKRGRDWMIKAEEVERYKRERRPAGRPRKDMPDEPRTGG